MQEVEDEQVPPKSLPADSPVVLMSEEEFQGTLKKGKHPDEPEQAVQCKNERGKRVVESLECQPTSSQVKVEDLVKDEVYSTMGTVGSTRSLMDRPVPRPGVQWAYDPRMP